MAPYTPPLDFDPTEHRIYARAVADTLRPNNTQKSVSLRTRMNGNVGLMSRVTLIVAGSYIVVIGLCG